MQTRLPEHGQPPSKEECERRLCRGKDRPALAALETKPTAAAVLEAVSVRAAGRSRSGMVELSRSDEIQQSRPEFVTCDQFPDASLTKTLSPRLRPDTTLAVGAGALRQFALRTFTYNVELCGAGAGVDVLGSGVFELHMLIMTISAINATAQPQPAAPAEEDGELPPYVGFSPVARDPRPLVDGQKRPVPGSPTVVRGPRGPTL